MFRHSWTNKAPYYSFKIFSRFWLVKFKRIIHNNQLLFTKYWTNDVKSAARCKLLNRWRQNDVKSAACCTTSFPGSSLYFEKVSWLWLVTCLCMPTQAGWVLNLILSTLSREVNVALLYGRYFEKEVSYLSEILPGFLLRLYLNFYEYEMLIERELNFAYISLLL